MIKRFVSVVTLLVLLMGAQPVHAGCTGGACVYGDGGLAGIDTGNGLILGPVLNALLGQDAIDINVLNHQALVGANADVSLLTLLPLLQAELGVAEPAQVLDSDITLLSFINVAADAIEADGNLLTAEILRTILIPIPGLEGIRIPLGFLNIDFDQGSFTDIDINVLNLLTWGIQLFNYENALTTPQPLKFDNSLLPPFFQQAGLVNELEVFLQVVEPPVFGCSQVGTVFRSPAMRGKINLDLVDNTLSATPLVSTLLTALGPLADVDADIRLADINIYFEIASTTATVNRVGLFPPFAELAVEPGVAHAWIGHIDDEFFFNPNRAINTEQDLSYGEVAGVGLRLGVLGAEVANFEHAVSVRSHSTSAATAELLQYFGPFPETQSSSGGTASASRLLSNLLANLDIRVDIDADGPDEGGVVLDGILDTLNIVLDTVLEILDEVLDALIGTLLRTVVEPVLEQLVDLLLSVLGIQIAEGEYTVAGVYEFCDITGRVFHDENHDGRGQFREGSPQLNLWAKRRGLSGIVEVVPVDVETGLFRFDNVFNGPQSIIIDDNNDETDFEPNLPAGWIGTRPERLRYDLIGVPSNSGFVDFGVFNGSRITGNVFIDNGVDARGNRRGGANNGVLEAHERGVSDSRVVLTTSLGNTLDETRTNDNGDYTLWLPATSSGSVRVKQFNRLPFISTGAEVGNSAGFYVRLTDIIRFDAAAGEVYSGLNFGDVVPATLLPNHVGYVAPGGTVVYSHKFVSGTEGSLDLTVENLPVGWIGKIYEDKNCNGRLDAEDRRVTETLVIKAISTRCLLLSVTTTPDAEEGDRAAVKLAGSFKLDGSEPLIVQNVSATDTTIISSASAGIRLDKLTDKTHAKPGEVVTFTLRYVNTSDNPITDLVIEDIEPVYTTVVNGSVQCGALPADITDCVPSHNGRDVSWQLSGQLAPNSEGLVSFQVRLDE